jgi:hypothetical protein
MSRSFVSLLLVYRNETQNAENVGKICELFKQVPIVFLRFLHDFPCSSCKCYYNHTRIPNQNPNPKVAFGSDREISKKSRDCQFGKCQDFFLTQFVINGEAAEFYQKLWPSEREREREREREMSPVIHLIAAGVGTPIEQVAIVCCLANETITSSDWNRSRFGYRISFSCSQGSCCGC